MLSICGGMGMRGEGIIEKLSGPVGGKAVPLKGNLTGLYRWRVGQWRVIYEVDAVEQVVYVLEIVIRGRAYG